MPELPEVETSCVGIRPHIQGKQLSHMIVRHERLRWPVPVDDLDRLTGKILRRVERRGKYLKFMFDCGYLLIHLGMSGSVRIVDGNAIVEKHDHIDWVFHDGVILRYNDPRRFGCCLYHDEVTSEHALLAALGPEPLTDDFNVDQLFQASRGKKQAVKTFIMDSHVVVGVGNIYASESLFKAGIHPKIQAGRVSKKRYALLVAAIKEVLAAAIAQGGTTLKDFVGGDGKPGYFQQELLVYGRGQAPCKRCGNGIKKITLGQRSTYYCSLCQK